MHTDTLDWSLPAHRRGTLCGIDAVEELTWTYLQRVPRRWTGQGPAAKPQISRSASDLSALSNHSRTREDNRNVES
ncbi:hypothetical protein D0A40_10785 [Xanthomonas campestris pv. raphani]|nr:hypothetical protein D0A40_10785 [Xanthomonas campestris pv. raphani]